MQHAAIWHWYLLLCIYITFKKALLLLSIPFLDLPGIDKSTEWSKIPTCPSLMCFFNRGNTEGINSSENLCLMFVYFLFMWLCVRTDFVVFG